MFDEAFRAYVHQTTQVQGGNLINSVRIEALSDALDSGSVDAVLKAAKALDDADRAMLADRETSRPFWDHVGQTLRSFDDIDALAEIIDSPTEASKAAGRLRAALASGVASGAASRTYTVQKGDTLGGLAEELLGDRRRWRELHELNRARIANAHVLRRGTVLTLPDDAVL